MPGLGYANPLEAVLFTYNCLCSSNSRLFNKLGILFCSILTWVQNAGCSNSSRDRKKSIIKMDTQLVTTAFVADSPTSFAPPFVVKPQLQPMTATSTPKINPFSKIINKSDGYKKFLTDSKNVSGIIW